jgi:hypothetical protein
MDDQSRDVSAELRAGDGVTTVAPEIRADSSTAEPDLSKLSDAELQAIVNMAHKASPRRHTVGSVANALVTGIQADAELSRRARERLIELAAAQDAYSKLRDELFALREKNGDAESPEEDALLDRMDVASARVARAELAAGANRG